MPLDTPALIILGICAGMVVDEISGRIAARSYESHTDSEDCLTASLWESGLLRDAQRR